MHDKIDYLGHVISPGWLEAAPKEMNAIKKLKEPKNTTELRSFLGIFNIFSHFVPNFARISVPLNMKLRNGQPKKFDVLRLEENIELSTLQERLATPTEFSLKKSTGEFTLDTDACDLQVCSVILQEREEDLIYPFNIGLDG